MPVTQYTLDIERKERVRNDGGGFTLKTVGYDHVTVIVDVDVRGIARELTPRAMRSKAKVKKATSCHRLVVVKVVKVSSGRSIAATDTIVTERSSSSL